MRAGGIPARVSNAAGTFVCNHLFYGTNACTGLVGSKRRENSPPYGRAVFS
jgi:pyrrolidone-carboxylate peptidase